MQVLKTLPDESVQCCVTSPPYWGLRDYGSPDQLGLEKTPDEYVQNLVAVFREVKRVLKKDGTLWLNLGDSYNAGRNGGHAGGGNGLSRTTIGPQRSGVNAPGLKPKDLVGVPWLVAFALRADGWYLRSEIIWHKRNPMPSSVTDRPTTSHEHIFLLAKSSRYYYDADAIKEQATHPEGPGNIRPTRRPPGEPDGEDGNIRGRLHKIGPRLDRNKRTVWSLSSQPYKLAHFATYPPKLIRPCILAGSRPGDTVLDPFNGAGTTGLVAMQLRRKYIGIDVNAEYLDLTRNRLAEVQQEICF
jgi:DNA modification methylase